jgi:hypothetical protein
VANDVRVSVKRSPCVTSLVLLAAIAALAACQQTPVQAPPETQTQVSTMTQQQLKARCTQLINYYERYGASRGEDFSGARHIIRQSAGVDCGRGQYVEGIKAMEGLLTMKKYTVPPPCDAPDRPRPSGAALPGGDAGCA